MSIRTSRLGFALENALYREVPVADALTATEREADEQSANARVRNEVPGYTDTLPSLLG